MFYQLDGLCVLSLFPFPILFPLSWNKYYTAKSWLYMCILAMLNINASPVYAHILFLQEVGHFEFIYFFLWIYFRLAVVFVSVPYQVGCNKRYNTFHSLFVVHVYIVSVPIWVVLSDCSQSTMMVVVTPLNFCVIWLFYKFVCLFLIFKMECKEK